MIHSKFKDEKGRTWDLSLNVGILERVERDTGFAVDSLVPAPTRKAEAVDLWPFQDFIADERKIFGVVYAICSAQAEALGVTRDDFAAAFGGKATEEAPLALMQALSDFFRHPVRKEIAKRILQRGMKVLTAAAARMTAEMDKREATLEKDVNDAIDQALSNAATNLPAA